MFYSDLLQNGSREMYFLWCSPKMFLFSNIHKRHYAFKDFLRGKKSNFTDFIITTVSSMKKIVVLNDLIKEKENIKRLFCELK